MVDDEFFISSKRATTAFTPFSVMLGHTLQSLHLLLGEALATQRHVPALVATLKCVVACVQATPYAKLGGALLTGIVANVRKLLLHRGNMSSLLRQNLPLTFYVLSIYFLNLVCVQYIVDEDTIPPK